MTKRYVLGMVAAGVLGAFAASGTGSVFDDCVYWFCGGRDSNEDGFLQSGELLDTMHANDTSHNAHTCTLYGWSRVSGQKSRGVQLREEDVYCPAQGVTNRTLCLYLPQSQDYTTNYVENADGSITTNTAISYYCNNAVLLNFDNMHALMPTNVYTFIMRIRREQGLSSAQWFFNGYNGPGGASKEGMLMGFDKSGNFVGYVATGKFNTSSPTNLPVNCWADIAVVVMTNRVRIGIWKDPIKASIDRDSKPRYYFATSVNTPSTAGVYANLTATKFYLGAQDAHTSRVTKGTNTEKFFVGSIQQIAFWNRALTDDEVIEAWQTPMVDVWRLGLVNDSTAELGGTAAATATVDIDAISADGRWADVPGAIPAGGTLNLDFTLRKSRFGADKTAADSVTLPQLLNVRTLSTADEGAARVTVNGTTAGTIRLKPNATNTLFLAAKLFHVTGVNRIALTRTDAGSSAIGIDQIKLTGSFQAGIRSNNASEFSATPGRCHEVGWPQQSDWHEVRNALNSASNSNTTNYWMHVIVPDEAADYGCTYTVRLYQNRGDAANTNVVRLCVNGVEKIAYTNDAGLALRQLSTSATNYEINFEPGELKAGDNVLWWNQYTANRGTNPSCTYFDFHRFEVVAKPSGTFLILR